jgi:hypothetical protein
VTPCVEGTAGTEVCDGLDSADCDGLVDEASGTTTCGDGECERTVDNFVLGVVTPCVEELSVRILMNAVGFEQSVQC